jgi:hypothetical protein
MKDTIANYIKNISGWRTNRKLIIFSVDDYGNVRLNSKNAKENLERLNIPFESHFDSLDTLETRTDLSMLFEVLDSVKDKHGNPAKFTPYALPCNINFEAMAHNNYRQYIYELLPRTFEKLALEDAGAYAGTWQLWQDGINKGFLKPQFHGREHFNLNIFNDLLAQQNDNLLNVLKHNSYVSIPEHKNYKNGWTAAYSFQDNNETLNFTSNVIDGLKNFKEVYGYDATVFTAPAQEFPKHLESNLTDFGLKYLDLARLSRRHLGNNIYKHEKNILGGGKLGNTIVRNVVFEPIGNHRGNWVEFTFKQIEAAFTMKKPANISSHRVNFCGHIDAMNREKGLNSLVELLKKIVNRWPDVEFISADELGDMISNEENDK